MSIQFNNSVFKDLIEKYPEWNTLQGYLESEEGGLFRIADKNKELCLIRYDKNTSKMDLPHSNWFRSVVWNTRTNRPISVAPPKASTLEFSYKRLNDVNEAGIVCEEFLDGFMINCFRMVGDNKLYITSRSKLDATGNFYSPKSFRSLFIESYLSLSDDVDQDKEVLFQVESNTLEYPNASNHETSVYYSFLVQHKEHRIVTNITQNRVFLVQKGVVYENGTIQVSDHFTSFRDMPNMVTIPLESSISKGSYAQIVSSQDDLQKEQEEEKDSTEVSRWIMNLCKNRSWQFQGVVFKDHLGNRWRFRSEKYVALKSLRGNSSTPLGRFSQLYTQNLSHTYLEYYPDDSFNFSFFTVFLNNIIQMIYQYYIDLHVTKTRSITTIDKLYHPYLYALHGIYLSQLRPNNKKITIQEIYKYLHKQPWQRIAFLIRKNQDSYFSQINEVVNSST